MSKIEQYTKKIQEAKAELENLPNMNRTKAQYANLIDKIEERKDLENITVNINEKDVTVLEVLQLAIKQVETPKEIKEKRKQLNHTIKVYENKILVELGVKTNVSEDQE